MSREPATRSDDNALLQEYQARRVRANAGQGVLPAAWIIASGRGDQVRRLSVVEFKVEYTERDAPPLDEYIAVLSDEVQQAARREKVTRCEPHGNGRDYLGVEAASGMAKWPSNGVPR